MGCTRSHAARLLSTKVTNCPEGPARTSYRTTLDAPATTASTVSRWLGEHHRAHSVLAEHRAATPWGQAAMLLHWMIEGAAVAALARDDGSLADDRLSVPASRSWRTDGSHVPPPAYGLERARETASRMHGGTPLCTDRVAARNPDPRQHRAQSPVCPSSCTRERARTAKQALAWAFPAEPGSIQDITINRTHISPSLCQATLPGYAAPGRQGPSSELKPVSGPRSGTLDQPRRPPAQSARQRHAGRRKS